MQLVILLLVGMEQLLIFKACKSISKFHYEVQIISLFKVWLSIDLQSLNIDFQSLLDFQKLIISIGLQISNECTGHGVHFDNKTLIMLGK